MESENLLLLLKVLLALPQLIVGSPLAQMSVGCGSSVCCLSWPKGCSGDSCGIIVRYNYETNQSLLNVEIGGKVDGWVAFGLNRNKGMMDGVKGELCYKEGSSIALQQFENKGTDFEFKGKNLLSPTTRLENGTMVCSYKRPYQGLNMYALSESLYLISSWGSVETKNGKGKPHEHKTGAYFWTAAKVDLPGGKCGKVEGTKWDLIAVHGGFMVVAWIALATTGILFMRYGRPLFPENMCLSQKLWFQVHRFSLFLALVLTVAGIIVVFVQAGGWRAEMGAHPYTGICVLAFAVLQALCALLRPSPGHEKPRSTTYVKCDLNCERSKRRWIFNWGHRIGGISTLVLSIVTIFLGTAYMETTPVALIVYLVLMLIAIVFMEVKQRLSPAASGSIQADSKEKADTPTLDSRVRKVSLVLASAFGWIFSVIIIALIGVSASDLTGLIPS